MKSSAENDVTDAGARLASHAVSRIAMTPSPEGSPISLGFLFKPVREVSISYQSGGRSFHGHLATEYVAVGAGEGIIPEPDRAQGIFGSFLIGSAYQSNVWRIRRAQVTDSGRPFYTLQPVKPAAAMPEPDFSVITDEVIRVETQKCWDDLIHALGGGRVSGVVTGAKQVAEHILYFELLRSGRISGGNYELSGLLNHLKTILEDKKERSASVFTYLDYHLMQKLRILHGGTHIGRIVVNGRPVSSEFGMTVALDLVEVLTSFGAVKQP